MSGKAVTAVLAVLSLFCLSMAAGAQAPSCGPRDQVTEVLDKKYKEFARAAGLMNDLALLEVYASERGTWTIVVTNSAGMTCVLAAGEAWDELPPMKKGKPS